MSMAIEHNWRHDIDISETAKPIGVQLPSCFPFQIRHFIFGSVHSISSVSGSATNSGEPNPNLTFTDSIPPILNFISPTPDNSTSTTDKSIEIKVNITESKSIREITYNWNGTDYTFYDDSLVLLYNFDNVSAVDEDNRKIKDASLYGNDGTPMGNAIPTPDGKYRGAYQFDGEESSIRLSNDALRYDEGTIAAWIKLNYKANWSANRIIQAKTENDQFTFAVNYGTLYPVYWEEEKMKMRGRSKKVLQSNRWYHVAYVSSISGHKLYINGEQVEMLYREGNSNIPCFFGNVSSGYDLTVGLDMNGMLDDLMVWNRCLSVDELKQLYMTHLYKYDTDNCGLYVKQTKNPSEGLEAGSYSCQVFAKASGYDYATEKMNINITTPVSMATSPTEGANFKAGDVTFECNATDDYGNLTKVTLYIWRWTGELMSVITKPWPGTSHSTSFTHTFAKDDIYKWSFLVYDNNSQCDWSEKRTLYIGTDGGRITNNVELNAYDYYDAGETWYLANDINCSDTVHWYNGEGWIPKWLIGGTFDGKGHVVSGLHIDRPQGYQALFGGIWGDPGDEAYVRNLGVIDSHIKATGWAAGLSAYIGSPGANDVHVTNSYVENCIVDSSVGDADGAMFATAIFGTVSQSYVSCGSIICDGAEQGRWCGGFAAGIRDGGTVTDCYSTADVTGEGSYYTGGFVGNVSGANSTVINCYSNGRVSGGSSNLGGFAGASQGICSHCFWDKDTSGQSSSVCGTGKVTSEMKKKSTYTNWDFSNIWEMNEDVTYPLLQWQPKVSLHEAMKQGDIEKIKQLITKGGDVNARDERGQTPLSIAIREKHVAGVELLLSKGADVNAKDDFGWTPLHFATDRGSEKLIKLLLVHGGNVNTTDRNGETPLHLATELNRMDLIELLLATEANVNAQREDGFTPLLIAVSSGRKDLAERLITRGAEVNEKCKEGSTPLHIAIAKGQRALVELLIAEGADVNAKSNYGHTPLDVAALRKRNDIVEWLTAEDANYSPHVAARLGLLEEINKLVKKGIDLNVKDTSGRTALHYAARQGHKEMVTVLLANDAEVNIGEKYYNRTAAEMAMAHNHTEIVKLLVSKGADVSPLHMALYMKDRDKAKSLIESGADIYQRTPYGTTPLDRAINVGFKDIVELLIEKGADVNAKDNWDWTPLHSAVYGHKDIVELLIANGANVNAKDGGGRTPIWYAKKEDHHDIVELLQKHGAQE